MAKKNSKRNMDESGQNRLRSEQSGQDGEKVVKFHREFHLNIGFVIFAIIIVYVLFNVFSYMTSTSIAEYEVTQGTIAANHVYKGLILRDETIYYSEHSGYINYYVRNASKVGAADVIYSIDTDGRIAKQITDAGDDGSELSAICRLKVQSELSAYADSFDPTRFSTVYNFKNDINSELSQNLSTAALSRLGKAVTKASKAKTFYQITAQDSGIVLYSVDGMESLSTENFSAEDLNAANYLKTNLDTETQVSVADPVFKLIGSEKWNVILPITEEIAGQLEEKSTLRVRFCLDGYETYASFSVIEKKNAYYLNLEFSNAMIRYASERYVDVELVLDVERGLKIPNSAITTKEFFAIPKEYFTKGDNSTSEGLLVQQLADGKVIAMFVSPTIYSETETAYYVDSEELESGDILILNDSKETYTVGTDTGTLQGVYNINKGYAVFKQIRILYQNEEYAIVEPRMDFGIVLYDHIALDSSKVSENDFIVK